MWNNNDSLPNPRLGHGIAGFIHQPQPRQAQPVFRFSSRSEELADPSLCLPTPTSSPAPRLKDLGSRLNIEQLARCDAELGNSDALSRALDALPRRESSCNMVTLNREQEGEYVVSARSFEYDEVRSAYKYAKDLCDGRIPVQPELPRATNPVRVPNVHAYLTPPSSPETRPERRCSNIEEVVDLSLDGESTLVDVPASQGEPDKERELNDNKKPADLNSNESGIIDWYDDDAGEYFEYDSDDDNESVTEFSSEIEEPRPVTLLPPPEYNDLRGFTASPLNLPDLTPALALSSFPEWPVARGGFGEVWKGDIIDKSKTGRQAVAVKRLTIYTDKGEEGARKVLKRTAREIHIWSCLRHRNVLPLLGFCTFRGGIGLVSPWQEAGHVTSWVNKNPSADRLELCEGICAGLAYLHERNVIHGDLRGANVLISLDGTPRLIDFGLATVVDSIRAFSDSSTIAGAVRWMAPELQVTESCGITRASDMFALAMTMLEVYTGAPPFSGIKNDLAVLLKYQQGKRPLCPAVADHNHPHGRNSTNKEILNVCAPMSNSMWDLVQRCWDQSPSGRPTAKSVLREIRRQRKRPR